MDVSEPAGIMLLINQAVLRLRCAQTVTPDLQGAMIVVELDIKEGARISAPDDSAVSFLDQIVQVLLRRPFANADRKIFRTIGVGAPGVKPVIGRMSGAAELEIIMTGSKGVAVEDGLDLAAVAGAASEHLMLAALAEFSHIGKFPI